MLAFRVFYWYKAVDGTHVPTSKSCVGATTFVQAMAMVKRDNEGSVTPIVRFVPPADYEKHMKLMTELLALTPAKQTGLIHSLRWTMKELRPFI